ncbi:hypothetical protein EKO27_g8459 [Xylaria grammica]|uniref:Nephrocystin 3-like N-terminal domain-containing protein n=1 Tax=Xylaria grammica TaxID=363999 RepID=A0A439CX06_9PEZI|nr:hypothetical protein EKO27_g8459 [Xylaria grammica]
MDILLGLRASSSIVQLIKTTAQVIEYVNDVKNAPTERAQLARHASSLLALLNDLRYRVEEAKSSPEPWLLSHRKLDVEQGPLDQLRDQMERLATKLKPSTRHLKTMRKALTWTLDKNEIEAVLTQIERVKALVTLALQNDQFKLTLAMKQDVMDVKEDLRTAIGESIAERQDVKLERESGSSLTLDSRIAGAGKTTLASMVVDWLESKHRGTNVAVIYIYCNYKEEQIQTPRNMIGSLLKQLIQRRAVLPDHVRGLYKKNLQTTTHLGLDELTRALVQEMTAFSSVFVVIDALDECPERGNTRARLLTEVQKLPQNARILITSRYSSKIEGKFENVLRIDIRETDDDVKRYVEARIEKETSLAKHVRPIPALMEDMTKTVIQNSQGMFLLAQLHMDSLGKKLTRREIRAALGSLPKELDETYDQAMLRIQNQDEGQAALAHRVL